MSTSSIDSQVDPDSENPEDHSLLPEQSEESSVDFSVGQILDAETVVPTVREVGSASDSIEPSNTEVLSKSESAQLEEANFSDPHEMFSHYEPEENDEENRKSDSLDQDEKNWQGYKLGAGERYEVTGFIGHGGMANVHLAVDHNRNDIEVAIKVPFRKFLNTRSMRERFQRESLALVSLEHPNICRVIDTGYYKGTPFVVLQKLGGGNLRDFYHDVKFADLDQIYSTLFGWLEPISKALDFIHQQDYIHRDVKPENILFDEHKHAFLGDFGIVRLVGEHEDLQTGPLTQFESWMGTPGYVAPEIGTVQKLDAKCDQYSLACVVYVCLTKQAPFPGKTATEYRLAQATMDPVSLHELNPSIPAAVSIVMERALSVSPANRFRNCQEFVEALRTAFNTPEAHGSQHSDVPPLRTSASRKLKRKPLLLVLLGCITVAVILFFVIPTMNRHAVSAVSEPQQSSEELNATTSADSLTEEPSSLNSDDLEETELVTRQQPETDNQGELPAVQEVSGSDPIWKKQTVVRQVETKAELAAIHYADSIKYVAAGELEAALDSLNIAIDRNPTLPEYYASRGFVLAKLNRQQDAIDQFTQAIHQGTGIHDDVLSSWYSARAAAQSRSGEYRAALKDVSKAIELNPADSQNYRNRAGLHRLLGEDNSAEADIQKAVQLEG